MEHLESELSKKLNSLDIETSYEEEVLFALMKGGASLPDDGFEIALDIVELGPRALAVRAQHLMPIQISELSEPEKMSEILESVRRECLFARSVVIHIEDEDEPQLLIDATFLISDLRLPQIQTLLTGLTLFAEEALLTIGTLYYSDEPIIDKEKN